MLKTLRHRRFKPLDIAIAMLLAGWVPSILMAIVSYTILRDELEQRVLVERRTLVQTIAHIVSYDLVRTREIVEYYQTLPFVETLLLRPAGDPGVQTWLADAYYSHPRFDGLFLADHAGRITASVPIPDPEQQIVFPEVWLAKARPLEHGYVTPIHARHDGRLVTTVVAAIHSKSGELVGYIGAEVLIERLGRRIAPLNFGEQSFAQVLDQDGSPLFNHDYQPNGIDRPETDVLELIRQSGNQTFRRHEFLYTFSTLEDTGWTTLLQEPIAVAYRPVRDLLGKTAVLAAWLIAGTAIAAWLISGLYRNQLAADERIAIQTALNQKILANMPIAISTVDPATQRVAQANDSFFQLAKRLADAGIGAGDEVGEEEPALKLSDLHLELDDLLAQIATGGQSLVSREQSATSAIGGPMFLTITLVRLDGLSAERDGGLLCLIVDNTAEVTTRQELINANTAKDQFLALLSHELRNPLSPVITMVAELESRARGDAATRRVLQIIRRNVELEARLIDDLLDITRITHGKLQLNREVIDAHEVISRAVEICDQDLREKKLRVIVESHADRHHAHADPARLQQIFWNLLKNGIKFTPEGEIRVRTRNENGQLVVEIQDTGLGIEPERLDHVFKAFEQGGSSMTRRFGGLGLGLAISRAMIEAHGGTIAAHSAGLGQGATFTVRLATCPPPVSTMNTLGSPADPLGSAADPPGRPTGRRRILVVDDHHDTCEGMRLVLTRRGYEVAIAHSVAEGLAAFSARKIDLVLSDLGLPDGTGFDLMSRVRELDPAVPGIALSGFGMESDIAQSRAAGFAEHLIKPVNLERLDRLLKQMLGTSPRAA